MILRLLSSILNKTTMQLLDGKKTAEDIKSEIAVEVQNENQWRKFLI
jgi:hypothetical protein